MLRPEGHNLRKLACNLCKFGFTLLINFRSLSTKDSVDFGLEAAHVIVVILLDNLFKLCLFFLELSFCYSAGHLFIQDFFFYEFNDVR